MLKKIIAIGFCAMSFMACEEVLDPTSPESIRRYYSKLSPPVQMSNDQFVSYIRRNSIDKENMDLFLVCSEDYLNTPNSKGNTAIGTAVNMRNTAAVEYLLSKGADISIRSNQVGMTPLEDASTRVDSVENGIFSMLVNAQKQKDPELLSIGLALHLAARFGAVENVKILIENGANPNAKNLEGLTPLHEAAKEGRKPVVEYLVSKKIEVNPLDKDGFTPIDWAEASGAGSTFPEVAKVLQKVGGKHTKAWRDMQ